MVPNGRICFLYDAAVHTVKNIWDNAVLNCAIFCCWTYHVTVQQACQAGYVLLWVWYGTVGACYGTVVYDSSFSSTLRPSPFPQFWPPAHRSHLTGQSHRWYCHSQNRFEGYMYSCKIYISIIDNLRQVSISILSMLSRFLKFCKQALNVFVN